MNAPEALLADRYRLVRVIASGGMGVVWEAWDERLDRTVAVKQLHTVAGITDEEAELAKLRAMREARITARLHHPHAVSVFDAVEHEGRPCLVMPFLEATPLSALLHQRGSLPLTEASRIGAEIASALAAAHRLGIVHRDVKPGNVLITPDGAAHISDFGISHAMGDPTLTAAGMFHGTPAYLAPEVARGQESTFASDVFSLGSTLYAAVEGEPPFGSEPNSLVLLHKVAAAQVHPPRHAGPLTPFLLKMLSRDPQARPTMEEVAAFLVQLEPPAPLAEPASRLPIVVAQVSAPAPATRGPRTTPAAPAPPVEAAQAPHAAEAARDDPSAVASAPKTHAEPELASAPKTHAEPELIPTARTTGAATAPPAPPSITPAGAAAAPVQPPPDTGHRPARRRAFVPILVVVSIVAALFVAFAALTGLFDRAPETREPDAGPTAAATAGSPEAASPTPRGESAVPAPEQTAGPSATPEPEADDETEAATQSTPEPEQDDDGADRAGQLASAVTDYYALMPEDTDAAWPRMTDDYRQNHAGGRAAFEAFWGDVAEVTVSEVDPSPPDRAEATLTYVFDDGRVVVERTAYQFAEQGGTLRIAATEVLSSSGA